MKLLGRIIALLLAGVISVLTVQRVFKRMYDGMSRKYIELPQEPDEDPIL